VSSTPRAYPRGVIGGVRTQGVRRVRRGVSRTCAGGCAGVRPTYFFLTLRPEPGIDGIHALRAALKTLLRRFGLRAVEAWEERE
jgi:hypothetical protein